MSSGLAESTKSASCSSENSSNKDAADFECNICFDSAREPVVTLCGHLFCWPCLYRWLHHRSHPQECPVCKALVGEEKLVPLYGKGKSITDPTMESYLRMEIPRRPSDIFARLEQMRLSCESTEQRFKEYRESTEHRFKEYRESTEQNFNERKELLNEYKELLNDFMEFHDKYKEFRAAVESRLEQRIKPC